MISLDSPYDDLKRIFKDRLEIDQCEEALVLLNEIESTNKIIKEQFDAQAHDVENLTTECKHLKDKVWRMENETLPGEIDFGTGKLNYSIHKGSTILLRELMQSLEDAALVVPLTSLIKSIKSNALNQRF